MMQAQRYVSINNEVFSFDLPVRPTTVLAEYSSASGAIGNWLQPVFLSKDQSPEAIVFGTDVTYDALDRIILIGFFGGNLTIEDYVTKEEKLYTNMGDLKDGFIAAMESSNSSKVFWFFHIISTKGTIYPLSVDVDNTTNAIYVSGFFTGSIELGQSIYTIPPSVTATFLLKLNSQGQLLSHQIIVASSMVTFTRLFYRVMEDVVVVSGSIQGVIQCELSSIPLQQCIDVLQSQDAQDPHISNRDNFVMAFKGSTLELSAYNRLTNFNHDAFVTGSSAGRGDGNSYFSGYTLSHNEEGRMFEDKPFVIAYSIASNNVSWIRYFPNGRSYDCSYFGGYLYCARATQEGTYITKLDPQNGNSLYEKLFSGGYIALLDLQFDSKGNLFICGHYSSNITLESDLQITSLEKRDGFLLAIRDGCSCDDIYCKEPICYGKRRFDQTSCSSRGSCASPNSCICPKGVQGFYCEQFLCNGISSSKREVCSGRGYCIGVDICVCNSGYNGTFCENIQCDPPCSNNSTCIAPNICSCTSAKSDADNILFTGQDCSIAIRQQNPSIPTLYIQAPNIKLNEPQSLFKGLPFRGNGTELFRSYLGKNYYLVIQLQSNIFYSRRDNRDQMFRILNNDFITVDTSLDRKNLDLYVVGYTLWGREFIILKLNPFTNTIIWMRKTEMIPSQEGELYIQSVNMRNEEVLLTATCEGSFLLENCYFFLSEGKTTVLFALDTNGVCKWKNTIVSSTGFNMGIGGIILRNFTDPTNTYQYLAYGTYTGVINSVNGKQVAETNYESLFASLYYFNEREEIQQLWFSNLLTMFSKSTPVIGNTRFRQDTYNNFLMALEVTTDTWIPKHENISANFYFDVQNRKEVLLIKYDSQGNALWTTQFQIWGKDVQADTSASVSLLDMVLDNINNIYVFISLQQSAFIVQVALSSTKEAKNLFFTTDCSIECSLLIAMDMFGKIKDVVKMSIANGRHASLSFDNDNSFFNISMSMYSIGIRKQAFQNQAASELVATEILITNAISLLWLLIVILIIIVLLGAVLTLIVLISITFVVNFAYRKAKVKLAELTRGGVYANLLGEQKELFSRDFFVMPYEEVQPKFTKIIGEGSYGVVYELLFENEVCAAKVFKLELHDKFLKEKVIDEIDKVLKLSHDYNIIRCIKILSGKSHIGYIMPKADCDLKAYLKQNFNSLSIQDKLRLLISICNGMSTLHKNQLIHRDLKPENVLIIQGHAKISDFDSCLRGGLDSRKSAGTVANRAGTWEYLAPECFEDMNAVSFPSDVYSFGVIMLQVMCGVDVVRPRQRIKIPLEIAIDREDIKTVIEKCLEDDPKGRPSFTQLASQLQEIINKL